MKIKIIKFRNDVKIPTRKHYNDAGLDCYCCEDIELIPHDLLLPNEEELKKYGYDINTPCNLRTEEEEQVRFQSLERHTTYKVPLGFGLDLPDGYVAIIKPRSSMNLKGILTYEGIIDSGFKNEISAVFSNLNDAPITLHKGDRICQLLIVPIAIADIVEDLGEERGLGGFGSTGK